MIHARELRELVQHILDTVEMETHGNERLSMMAMFMAAAALARAYNMNHKTFFEGVELAWEEIQKAEKKVELLPPQEPSVH